MEFLLILLLVLCLLLLMFIAVFLWNRKDKDRQHREMREQDLRNRQMMDELSQRMSKELLQFQHLLHQNMQSDLHTLREDTTQRLFSMEKSMSQTMQVQIKHTGDAFNTMMNEVTRLQETQKRLSEISTDITSLQMILNDKKTRGIFGEIELYSLLENAMGDHVQRWGKQVKLSNGMIADAVLYSGEKMPKIIIDSKFPLENYQRLLDANLAKEEQRKAQNKFVADVKKHIAAISGKYIIADETADFAFLFLPAESLFSYIHANCPQLVEYGFHEHVYLVSPTTLMAYITAIKAIYLNQQQSSNMIQIQQELKKLAQEFERFEKRYTTVSTDFERTYQDMRQLAITAEKLNKRFNEIVNVQLHQEGDHHERSREEEGNTEK